VHACGSGAGEFPLRPRLVQRVGGEAPTERERIQHVVELDPLAPASARAVPKISVREEQSKYHQCVMSVEVIR